MNETIRFDSLPGRLVVEHGSARPGKITLYSIMRNERFFLDAFFDHYRNLGVEQFLVLDDGSTDGSIEYFKSQPDCVLLSSPLKYGTDIAVAMPDGRVQRARAGVFFKRVIPEAFCPGDYAIYADADEFLVLPPEVPNLAALFDALRRQSIDCVASSLVEFYPASLSDLKGSPHPGSFSDLVSLYPYFDAVPLVKFRPGIPPKRINGSASKRLFHRHGISLGRAPSRFTPQWLARLLPGRPGKSATMKTPIIRWRKGVWISDTHRSNVKPTDDILLAFAHFKFTHKLAQKTEEAIRLRSYAGKSQKYELYSELMARMSDADAEFLGPNSRRYKGPADFAVVGLVKCTLA